MRRSVSRTRTRPPSSTHTNSDSSRRSRGVSRSYSFGEPVEIERVELPVRIEKRQAALLADLAKYKCMSVSNLLEEILLHTSERIGDGVASPHTLGQLEYIQELKNKHGIDYDTHATGKNIDDERSERTRDLRLALALVRW